MIAKNDESSLGDMCLRSILELTKLSDALLDTY